MKFFERVAGVKALLIGASLFFSLLCSACSVLAQNGSHPYTVDDALRECAAGSNDICRVDQLIPLDGGDSCGLAERILERDRAAAKAFVNDCLPKKIFPERVVLQSSLSIKSELLKEIGKPVDPSSETLVFTYSIDACNIRDIKVSGFAFFSARTDFVDIMFMIPKGCVEKED